MSFITKYIICAQFIRNYFSKLFSDDLGQSTVLQGSGRIPPINIDRRGGFRPGGSKELKIAGKIGFKQLNTHYITIHCHWSIGCYQYSSYTQIHFFFKSQLESCYKGLFLTNQFSFCSSFNSIYSYTGLQRGESKFSLVSVYYLVQMCHNC